MYDASNFIIAYSAGAKPHEDPMKKHLALILAITGMLSFVAIDDASAATPIRQGGNFGFGLGGGTRASGLSFKYFMGDASAIQANVGYTYGHRGLGVSADYIIELPEFFTNEILNIGAGIGPGVGLSLGDNYFGASVSGALGLEFNFNVIPIDLVLEWRPTLAIVPDVDFDPVGFTGHIRLYLF